ncbi:MAG: hypothetical protein ACOC9P_00110 [bacterium]
MSRSHLGLVLGLALAVSAVIGSSAFGWAENGASSTEPQALPPGHPPLDGSAKTTPKSGTATLHIRAVQGTADGPEIGAAPVTVMLYQNGQVIEKLDDRRLNDDSELTLADYAFTGIIQPVATVTYDGVTYQGVGAPVQPDGKTHELTVTVHQSTDQTPDWRIDMRHVMVTPRPDGLHVAEVLAVHNPTDRAWTGDPSVHVHEDSTPAGGADEHGSEGVSFWLALPDGARQVQAGEGFHSCCTHVHDGVLYHQMPMTPGTTRMRLHYVVPIAEGTGALNLSAPVRTERLMVIVPQSDELRITSDQLRHRAVEQQGRRLELYEASGLAGKTAVLLRFAGLPTASAAGEQEASAGSSAGKAMVGTIAVLLLVGTVVLVVSRLVRPSATPAADASTSRHGGRGKR